jgi:hypothetical protein
MNIKNGFPSEIGLEFRPEAFKNLMSSNSKKKTDRRQYYYCSLAFKSNPTKYNIYHDTNTGNTYMTLSDFVARN